MPDVKPKGRARKISIGGISEAVALTDASSSPALVSYPSACLGVVVNDEFRCQQRLQEETANGRNRWYTTFPKGSNIL